MVFSIVKQSVDIRLRLALEKTPKLSADTECAVAIGMLAKMAGLPLPEKKATLEELVADLKSQTGHTSESPETGKAGRTEVRMERLKEILFAYEPKGGLDEEKYELIQYGYEQEARE